MRIVIVDETAISSGDISWNRWAGLGQLTFFPSSREALKNKALAEAEALVAVEFALGRDVLDLCPKLKYIGLLATGHDSVDLAETGRRGIVVTNVPAYGTRSVAQYTIALMLELCHQAGAHDSAVRRGLWAASGRFSFWLAPPIELDGKTLGLIGFGRIGREVARLAQAFGLTILPYNASAAPGAEIDGFVCRELSEVLADSDFLSLHCPLTTETRGLINSRTIASMKPGVRLINTARGALVQGGDLIKALTDGRIAAAAIDVTDPEPLPLDSPLLKAPNLIITPHIAWATSEARRRIVGQAADNFQAFIDGHPVNTLNRKEKAQHA